MNGRIKDVLVLAGLAGLYVLVGVTATWTNNGFNRNRRLRWLGGRRAGGGLGRSGEDVWQEGLPIMVVEAERDPRQLPLFRELPVSYAPPLPPPPSGYQAAWRRRRYFRAEERFAHFRAAFLRDELAKRAFARPPAFDHPPGCKDAFAAGYEDGKVRGDAPPVKEAAEEWAEQNIEADESIWERGEERAHEGHDWNSEIAVGENEVVDAISSSSTRGLKAGVDEQIELSQRAFAAGNCRLGLRYGRGALDFAVAGIYRAAVRRGKHESREFEGFVGDVRALLKEEMPRCLRTSKPLRPQDIPFPFHRAKFAI